MPLIRIRTALCSLLALTPALGVAQQNTPPRPGVLKPADAIATPAAKASGVEATKAATAVDRRMMLVGQEQELFAGLTLTAAQKDQLQRNLGKLTCVPAGTVMPPAPGRFMMQVMPTPPGAGAGLSTAPATAPVDECLANTLEAGQLAAFRAHLVNQLTQKGQDVAAFESNAPANCPLTELKYYLNVLSQL